MFWPLGTATTMCKLQTQSTLALASDSQRKQSIKLDKKDVEIVYSIMYSPGLPNGLKGLQPRAPKADGPQSQDNKSAHDDVKKCASKLVTGSVRYSLSAIPTLRNVDSKILHVPSTVHSYVRRWSPCRAIITAMNFRNSLTKDSPMSAG